MWCRTSTTSAATSASVTSSGNRLTSMCPGGSAKVCPFQLSAILYFDILSPPDFFIQLDQECGPLTLHSSLKDLVYYTRRGLRTLSASSSEEVPHPPFFHPPGPSEQDHKPVMKWNGGQLESQIWMRHYGLGESGGRLPLWAYLDIGPEESWVLPWRVEKPPFNWWWDSNVDRALW